MSLSDLASLGSFISALAVLISLIFLYFQLRQLAVQVKQAEKNQQAAIQQSRNHRRIDMFMDRATNPALAEALAVSGSRPNELTMTQWLQTQAYSAASFGLAEDTFLQHKYGLLSDEFFDAWLPSMKFTLSAPSARASWKRSRRAFGPEFVEFIDRLIVETPSAWTDSTVAFANWKLEATAEIARAAH